MKKLLLFLLSSFTFLLSYSQAPQGIPYQSVLRDAAGNLMINQNISMRFTILDSVATGNMVYRETQQVSTNNLGQITSQVGGGTPNLGTFAGINWAVNAKFLQVEMDVNGGSNFTSLGITQMMSVPFALYSNSSGTLIQNGSNSQTLQYTADGF